MTDRDAMNLAFQIADFARQDFRPSAWTRVMRAVFFAMKRMGL